MPHRVLLIACYEESREPAYLLSLALDSYGYSAENTHVDTHGDSKIKIDRIMEKEMSLSDFQGIVFMDDGGDEEIAKRIAKKALASEKVLGGFSVQGCEVLSKAGALKDAHVCAGLPEAFYKGTKEKIEAPSVRSDKIVTGIGNCVTGFTVVLTDALGGKVKRIIHSNDEETSEKMKISMARGENGWTVISSLPDNADLANKAREAALHAVIMAQAECDNPDEMSQAVVSLDFGENSPVVEEVRTNRRDDSSTKRKMIQLERELAREGVFVQPDGMVHLRQNPKGRTIPYKDAVEELARLALEAIEDEILEGDKPDPWTVLSSRRHRHVLRCLLAMLEMMGEKLPFKFASPSGGVFLGSTSIGGPNFGTAISDMDWRARVWPASEDEEWLKDREQFIEKLPRYNPEYIDQSQKDPNAYGVYYVWPEKNRGPIDWSGSIKEMKDKSPYKINDALKP